MQGQPYDGRVLLLDARRVSILDGLVLLAFIDFLAQLFGALGDPLFQYLVGFVQIRLRLSLSPRLASAVARDSASATWRPSSETMLWPVNRTCS